MLRRVKLFVDVVLTEVENRNQIGARLYCELDEALAAVEYETEGAGIGFKGLAGAANNDSNGASHAFVVRAAFAKEVDAGFFGHGSEAHPEKVFAVKGDPEVGVEG